MHDDIEEDFFPEYDNDELDGRFINFALLSNLAVHLRDKVPRSVHVKGGIGYPHAFTGKDIVVCHSCTFFVGTFEYHPCRFRQILIP